MKIFDPIKIAKLLLENSGGSYNDSDVELVGQDISEALEALIVGFRRGFMAAYVQCDTVARRREQRRVMEEKDKEECR